MDIATLESMDKSEFLPLTTVKQEDDGETSSIEISENQNIAANTSATNHASEISNPVCDSAEKQSEDGDKTNTNDEGKYNKCVFCSQHLVAKDIPKLMECLHVTCNVCITAKFHEIESSQSDGAVVHCPKCSTASKPDGLILNHFLIETEASAEESQATTEADSKALKCSSCSDDEPATSWCVECAEYICDSCVQAHQRLKITKDHTIKPKDEATDNDSTITDDKALMCQIHLQEKLSLFCETCDKLTCRDCQLVDHRDHKYKFANEIAADTRNSLAGLLNEITYKRVLLNSAMNVIDERQKLIVDKKMELLSEITSMVVQLTNAISARGKKLANQLTEVCDGKLKVLNEKKDALQSLSNHTDHCIEFVQFALDKGSDSAVLFSKKALTSHLQKVKCQRADIPNPEIPVRIHVQVSNVPDLQKVISQLGGVVVDGKLYPPSVSPNPIQAAARQQIAPNVGQSIVAQNVPVPNMSSPVSLQQQPMPPHRSGMPPPSRSPQIPGNLSMRNYPVTTPPLQQNANYPQQQQQQQQPPVLQTPPLVRSYSQEASMNVAGFGRYPNMAPRPNQFRQMTPHVSSSTHPQMGGANQTAQIPCGTGNEFNPMYPMNQQQQQGLPAQGMQMGHIPPPLSHQQNQMMMQQRQRQQQQQQQQHVQQHVQQQPTQQQTQQQQTQQQQQQQQHHMQDAVRLQMQKQMMQSRGHPPNYPMPQAQPMNNPMNQPRMMPNQNDAIFQKQLSYPPNPVANQPPVMNQSASSWHIPQSARQANGTMMNQQNQSPLAMQFCSNGRLNENSFKISLPSKLPTNPTQPATPVPVTSTNPKTPSPNTNDVAKDPGETIEKACAESVNNFTSLMETIAKLDSNGVQVLPEGSRGKTTSPQVSSTEYSLIAEADKQNKDDPNEDWCAVCQDGGELMCCDKCPKVFHQQCHVPVINPFPDENEPWQCMLCFNFNDMPLEPVIGDKRSSGLSPVELKRCQRILLELYCQNERSVQFRELEPSDNAAYYEIVKDPITLDIIRNRLDQNNPDRYRDVQSFINDVRTMFNNVYLYYQENTKMYKSAVYLEKFFDEQLAKLLPDYLLKKLNDTRRDRGADAKRIRIENEIPTEIIDDDD